MAVDRAFDAADVDAAGIGTRTQAAAGRGLHFQAHGNVLEQGPIAHLHPDAVSVLHDGRMRFQFPDAALHVLPAPEPVVSRLENPSNPNCAGGSGNDVYASRIGGQLQICEPGHAEGPLERTIRTLRVTEAHGNCEKRQQSHHVLHLSI